MQNFANGDEMRGTTEVIYITATYWDTIHAVNIEFELRVLKVIRSGVKKFQDEERNMFAFEKIPQWRGFKLRRFSKMRFLYSNK